MTVDGVLFWAGGVRAKTLAVESTQNQKGTENIYADRARVVGVGGSVVCTSETDDAKTNTHVKRLTNNLHHTATKQTSKHYVDWCY